MKKSLLTEYCAYTLARFLGLIVTSLPPKANYALGKIAGILGYSLLHKKRRIALKNLKTAFSRQLSYGELERIAKKSFISLALNIIEALYIPRIDSRYINRYVRIENQKYLDDALKMGKGVILLSYHLGNWELANIACGLQGYTYKVIVNEQRYPLLNELLNRARESKGCKTIPRGVALRQIVRALKDNEVVAMVGDQGGKEGRLSNFFGIPASTPSGFVRFALSTGAAVIPAIIIRERRFSHRIILEAPLAIGAGEESRENLEECLSRSNRILEHYVSRYPQEYFWFYKVWKYSSFKQAVVLSDGKAGHLRQSISAVGAVSGGNEKSVFSSIVEIKFRNEFSRAMAQVFLACGIDILESCLKRESYLALRSVHPDLVVSCGSSLAGISLLLARENLARSVCIMKPGMFGLKKFDLAIVPEHDKPPIRKNVAVTLGALNLIDEEYLKEQSARLKSLIGDAGCKLSIGLLLGGDSKRYRLSPEGTREVVKELKKACLDMDARLLVTTSRRTPKEIEDLIKDELKGFDRCKLLVIANERNIPEAVGGILGLSDFVLVSEESISMISEAASSGKYAGVIRMKSKFSSPGLRHERFLRNLERQGHVFLIPSDNIADKVKDTLGRRPAIKKLDDRAIAREAIKKLL